MVRSYISMLLWGLAWWESGNAHRVHLGLLWYCNRDSVICSNNMNQYKVRLADTLIPLLDRNETNFGYNNRTLARTIVKYPLTASQSVSTYSQGPSSWGQKSPLLQICSHKTCSRTKIFLDRSRGNRLSCKLILKLKMTELFKHLNQYREKTVFRTFRY